MQKSIRVKGWRKRASIKKMAYELLGKLRRRKRDVYRDLDDLAGSWSAREEKIFRDSLNVGRQIDEDLWR